MDTMSAVVALSALAQESRLGVFRLLIESGNDCVPAGEIARRLGVPHNTMSSHLSILRQSGLVYSERRGRIVAYAVDLTRVRELFGFLLEDCCQGRVEECESLLDAVLPVCGNEV